MMKKYLMMGASALVMGAMFTACSNDEGVTAEEYYQALYNQAFEKAFGKVSPNQDWGFGPQGSTRATRSGNMTGVEPVAQTSDGINANANEWADAADAPHGHGGWIVPDPLTAEQKAVVAAYFQTVTPLTYTDPQWPNFFVQQVYKGGDSQVRNTTEGITAADGTNAYTSTNMNLLTVGYNNQHINNFNAGTYSGAGLNTYENAVNADGTVNVLDNGYTVNEFDEHHHADQIMLMVNIDDTECMGYHCTATGVSLQRNDKAALVGWQTIRTWANANGLNGDCLEDGWNRSFVGFDLALKSQEDSYAKGENGEALYATFNDVPNNNNMVGVWDGTTITPIGTPAPAVEAAEEDITSEFLAVATGSSNQNGTSTCENGVCTLVPYAGVSFNFTHADWKSYDKLVVEYTSTVDATLWVNGESTNLATSATTNTVEVTLTGKNIEFWNYGPSISSNEAGSVTISKVTLIRNAKEADTTTQYYDTSSLSLRLMDSNMNQYAGESRTITDGDLQYTVDGKIYLNMETINDLLAEGFLPVSGSAMKTWAKWADSDGYYSDWIVTLTEAQRQTPPDPNKKSIRIMAEDLSASEASDFDFNDVVFDVEWTFAEGATSTNKVKVTLWAAGGTLPLMINSVNGNGGFEVHNALGVSEIKTMINTHAKDRAGTYKEKDANGVVQEVTYYWLDDAKKGKPYIEEELELANGASISKDDFETDVNTNLRVEVQKNGKWYLLTAERGKPACKFGCPVGTPWAMERHNMDNAFTDFKSWVNNSSPTTWYNSKVTEQVYNAGMSVICVHGQH